MPCISACSAGMHTPRREHRESREVPVWRHRGEQVPRGIVEHGWGKAEAQGQSGSWTGRNMTVERHEQGPGEKKPSLEIWCKHRSSVGKWDCAQSIWGIGSMRWKRRNLLQVQEKSRDTATSSTLQCWWTPATWGCHYWERQFQVSHPLLFHTAKSLLTCPHVRFAYPTHTLTSEYSTGPVLISVSIYQNGGCLICCGKGTRAHWGMQVSFPPHFLCILC